MNDSQFEELLGRLLDDELNQDEFQQLVREVQAYPERLEEVQDQLGTGELLALSEDALRDSGLFVAALQSRLEESRQERAPFVDRVNSAIQDHHKSQLSPSRRNLLLYGSAVAVVATVAVLMITFLRSDVSESTTLTVNEVRGSVRFTGDGGRLTESLSVGDRVGGGTFETLSPEAWAILEFDDGTLLTVAGRSHLTISDHSQKRFRLLAGHISADVARQPIGEPMVVETPAANIEVMGTHFDLDASPTRTQLAVNEGRVKLTRLADGNHIEVPAEHTVVATTETSTSLSLIKQGAPRLEWVSDLERDTVFGKWSSTLDMIGYKLKTAVTEGHITKEEASRRYKKAAEFDDRSGTVWAERWIEHAEQPPNGSTVRQIVVFTVNIEATRPVVLSDQATIRIKGVLNGASDLEIGIATRWIDGGFAGKYSTQVHIDEFTQDGDTFDIQIPIGELTSLGQKAGESPVESKVTEIWCSCSEAKAKFGITDLQLIVSQPSP